MDKLSDSQTPSTAKWLGYAGALPFLGLSVALFWLGHGISRMAFLPSQISLLSLSYGAIILSFLGGLHWGRAVTCPEDRLILSARMALIWSVSLSLTGWSALFLAALLAAVILLVAFAAALTADLIRWLKKAIGPTGCADYARSSAMWQWPVWLFCISVNYLKYPGKKSADHYKRQINSPAGSERAR